MFFIHQMILKYTFHQEQNLYVSENDFNRFFDLHGFNGVRKGSMQFDQKAKMLLLKYQYCNTLSS